MTNNSKSSWVSKARWQSLPEGYRKAVRAALGYVPVPEYVANIQAALHARGEHTLAHELLVRLDGEDDA